MERLLIQFLMPDNDARREAEELIKRLAKDPQVVPAVVHYLRPFKTSNVCQLFAVLLRKKITGHCAKLSLHVNLSVKSALIESITLDPSSLAETIGPTFQSHLADLQPILLKYLQDETSIHARVASLKAVEVYFNGEIWIKSIRAIKLFIWAKLPTLQAQFKSSQDPASYQGFFHAQELSYCISEGL